LYFNQRGIYTFDVPDLKDVSSTEKDIIVKVKSTHPADAITMTLSQTSPLDCGCYEPTAQCTTGLFPECSLPLRYCTSNSGKLYLEINFENASMLIYVARSANSNPEMSRRETLVVQLDEIVELSNVIVLMYKNSLQTS